MTDLIVDPEQALESELQKRWVGKKEDSEMLADVYESMGYDRRSERVRDCGSWLEFAAPEDFSEAPKLHFANFCRDRLCPLCCWRRSRKVFGQVSQVMDLIGQKYRFIFCTLTVRNCSGEELHRVIDKMQKAWNRLMTYKEIRQAFKGWFRAVEITRHPEYKPEIEYHPHFHIIFAVNPSYFTDSKIYIRQKRMCQLWAKAAQLSYDPVVDIRMVKPKASEQPENTVDVPELAAVAEVAKYSVKSADYLNGDFPGIQRAVAIFLRSLEGRRLCSYGGVFQKARKQLQLDDETDGDLIHTDPDQQLRTDVAQILYRYQWQVGLGYVLTIIAPLIPDVQRN